ncbi:MAG TPA: UDP-N-acetylmuramoyl-L-alanine--D-glutamate ligase [Bacteroidales bacterium]|nr:UDP-N-acetylmuramoyl-L-alanine--D-glutamate ligase [Bacteroidales bacterium]
MKRIVVLGGGESGTGAALLAVKQGFEVFLSDKNSLNERYKKVLINHEIKFEEGQHTLSEILKADEVIKSPGIPDTIPLIKTLAEKSIPIISELEFAARFTKAKLICVTGSNGKTTTSLLTYHILKNAGLNVGLAGNIGKSFAWQIAENCFDVYVLEVSSFQLDGMFEFKADIAILTNITQDHLDRYENSFENYVQSKFRMIQNMTSSDYLIYNADDCVIEQELARRNTNIGLIPFSLKNTAFELGAFVENEKMNIHIFKDKFTMTLKEMALQGKHNIYNSMAAGVVGKLQNIRNNSIKESLAEFQNVNHRMQYVATIGGVDYINDSKATNVNSTYFALDSIRKPIIWIVGGKDKGNDYSSLDGLVKDRVKAIVCLGLDNKKLIEHFSKFVPSIIQTYNAAEAVEEAQKMADMGDVVLLSPACASFDLFEDYEDRGNKFIEAVNQL